MARAKVIPNVAAKLGREGAAVADAPEAMRRAVAVERLADKSRLFFSSTHAAGNAAATYAIPLVVLPRPVRIIAVSILPAVAVTAAEVDYATLKLLYNDGQGGDRAEIAVVTTTPKTLINGGGSWVAWRAVQFPKPKSRRLEAGNALVVALEKANSGVAIPIHTWTVTYEELD